MSFTSLQWFNGVFAVIYGGLGVLALLLIFTPNSRKHTALALIGAMAFSLLALLLVHA
jgi:hypothetical protein